MSVLINFKICDNSEECGGIAACPIGALYWDDVNKTVAIDNTKCISCKSCIKQCEIGAIKVAENEEEYKTIQKEIDEDPRKISDLFIDRYGAQPVQSTFSVPEEQLQAFILKSKLPLMAELFDNDSIKCLLYSIPIKELVKGEDINYCKTNLTDNSLKEKFGVTKLPTLLFFRNEKLIGKVEGYFSTKKKEDLIKEIKKLIK
ncbi:MAG: 4Fe-4S binding protein [Patescibacteria group bacterium]|nr:4Fe-4S binding protein [Patescibacteria group bacterium]